MDLLSQLGLSLLDGGDDHVTDTTSGETVQAGTDTLDGDDVQVASTGVVSAVHDGTAAADVSVSFLGKLRLKAGSAEVESNRFFVEASIGRVEQKRTQGDRGSS